MFVSPLLTACFGPNLLTSGLPLTATASDLVARCVGNVSGVRRTDQNEAACFSFFSGTMSLLDLVSGFATRVADAYYGPPLITDATGTEEEYLAKYHEIPDASKKNKPTILGEGAFGTVRLVREVESDKANAGDSDGGKNHFAAKVLCKGYSINDDNTVFHPPKAGVLETEVKILRRLQGQAYNLKLVGVYEGRRYLYLVMELCLGGDLHDFRSACLQYYSRGNDGVGVSSASTALLPADVVREVTIRILKAVGHCHRHGVIHRDLKPANAMFVQTFDPTGDARPTEYVEGLRLIDYGSGCADDPPSKDEASEPKQHTTMAGSAFYNSPEMFARKYTYKTDIWSAGVTIYAFAAGFPEGDRLQSVVDTMHKAPSKGERDIKGGMMPPDCADSLPDSFWEMLDKSLLVYRHKNRPSADLVLDSCEFLRG